MTESNETQTQRTVTETFPVQDGLTLRLSFDPVAIREHYEDDEDDPTAGMTDEQLQRAGAVALTDDSLYEAFHHALDGAIRYVKDAE